MVAGLSDTVENIWGVVTFCNALPWILYWNKAFDRSFRKSFNNKEFPNKAWMTVSAAWFWKMSNPAFLCTQILRWGILHLLKNEITECEIDCARFVRYWLGLHKNIQDSIDLQYNWFTRMKDLPSEKRSEKLTVLLLIPKVTSNLTILVDTEGFSKLEKSIPFLYLVTNQSLLLFFLVICKMKGMFLLVLPDLK